MLRPTSHARLRWNERIGRPGLRTSIDGSIQVPTRHVRGSWGGRSRWKGASRYRVCSQAVFVVHGGTVVTTWELALEELGTVLVWLMTGEWLDGAAPG